MKSSVLQVKDYRKLAVKLEPFAPDEAALETELRRLTNPYIRWEAGKTVSPGDQVVCRLVSSCPRFNKEQLRFVAGSGMFHKTLEELSIGMTVGQTRKVDLPEGSVSLTLTGVMNRVVPALNDEMVERLNLEGIHTIKDYKAYLLAQQKEAAFQENLYDPLNELMDSVIKGSQFVLCKEDWAAAVQRELDRCRALCRQENMILEEMTPEQFEGRIPVRSYYELVAMVQDSSWNGLCRYLLGCWYAQSDGFHPGEQDYEEFIADYVKDWHVSEENAREANTYENFLFNQYAGHAYNVLTSYIREFY